MVERDEDLGHLRVSDAEREQVVDRLSKACGDGLLTLDEFAEQAGAAYAAVTRAELDAVVRDLHLPVLAPPRPEPAAVAGAVDAPGDPRPARRRWVVAVMGGEDRRGPWRVGRRTGAFALMGGVDLDLRDALLEGDEIEITAWAIMGGVTVVVPEGIPVACEGFMLMGGRSNRIRNVPPVPGAPTIRVKGYGLWGGIDVRSRPSRRSGEPDDPVAGTRERAAVPPARHHERVARRAERSGRDRRRVPPPPVPAEGGLVTVVCTDIAGSTRYADTLGDQRWRSVLQEHNALVREQLAAHGGTEVKTSGDGFLLTFTSARRAVQFAVEVQDRMDGFRAAHPEVPLEIRIGVHAGEVERDGDDVVGRNVSLACRLCDAAAPGEVLASSVVVDLADSASDLDFGAPRQYRLAGIERPVNAHPAHRR